MKGRLLVVALSLVGGTSLAQLSPDFFMSQFTRMEFLRNPAATGITPGNNLHLFNRNDLPTQFTSNQFNYFAATFDGSNDSSQLGFGVGAFFVREFVAAQNNTFLNAYTTGLDGAFSYQTLLNPSVQLRVGLAVGGRVKSVPVTALSTGLQGTDSRIIPAISFGIMIASQKAHIGAAAFNVSNPTVTFNNGPLVVINESRLYIVQALVEAYRDNLITITPAAALKIREGGQTPTVDGAVTGSFSNKLLFGIGFRAGQIKPNYLIGQAGVIINDFEVTVSYDHPLASAGVVALSYLEATVGITL